MQEQALVSRVKLRIFRFRRKGVFKRKKKVCLCIGAAVFGKEAQVMFKGGKAACKGGEVFFEPIALKRFVIQE